MAVPNIIRLACQARPERVQPEDRQPWADVDDNLRPVKKSWAGIAAGMRAVVISFTPTASTSERQLGHQRLSLPTFLSSRSIARPTSRVSCTRSGFGRSLPKTRRLVASTTFTSQSRVRAMTVMGFVFGVQHVLLLLVFLITKLIPSVPDSVVKVTAPTSSHSRKAGFVRRRRVGKVKEVKSLF